jgi:hypothetical protein
MDIAIKRTTVMSAGGMTTVAIVDGSIITMTTMMTDSTLAARR